MTRDGVRKELRGGRARRWTDAVATWRDAETVAIEYTVAGAAARSRLSRRLTDADWVRAQAP